MVDDIQPCKPGEQPTLHEILMAEKLDFEAKVQRAAKRKKWLKGIPSMYIYIYFQNLSFFLSKFYYYLNISEITKCMINMIYYIISYLCIYSK